MKKNAWKSYWAGVDKSFIDRQIMAYKTKKGYRKLLQAVPEIGENGRVLEIGAGRAWISRILREKGWHATAIDLDLDEARTNSDKVDNYVQADIYNLPFGDNSFDLVISCGLIEHFNLDELQKIIVEMRRVSKSVAAWFPSCGLEWKIFWFLRNILGANVYTQIFKHRQKDIINIFLSSGLNNVKAGVVFFAGIFRYIYIYGSLPNSDVKNQLFNNESGGFR